MKKILIIGAAGQTGTRLICRLKALGLTPHAMVTRAASADTVNALGAVAVLGDAWNEANLLEAMRGVDSVYYIPPSLVVDEPRLGRGVIAAAQQAGVGHFVMHGVMAPYLDNIKYHWAKQLMQRELYRSGIPYTVLLPTNFMQNVSWTWPLIAREGRWSLPYNPHRKLTWVDLDDVAEAAAIVLTEAGHEYGTYELCGTDAFLSRAQIADMMSKTLGRPISAVQEAPQEYLEHARKQAFFGRFSDAEVAQILAMFEDYDRYGMPAGNPRVLAMLLKREPASYQDFLERLVKPGSENRSGVTSYGLPS